MPLGVDVGKPQAFGLRDPDGVVELAPGGFGKRIEHHARSGLFCNPHRLERFRREPLKRLHINALGPDDEVEPLAAHGSALAHRRKARQPSCIVPGTGDYHERQIRLDNPHFELALGLGPAHVAKRNRADHQGTKPECKSGAQQGALLGNLHEGNHGASGKDQHGAHQIHAPHGSPGTEHRLGECVSEREPAESAERHPAQPLADHPEGGKDKGAAHGGRSTDEAREKRCAHRKERQRRAEKNNRGSRKNGRHSPVHVHGVVCPGQARREIRNPPEPAHQSRFLDTSRTAEEVNQSKKSHGRCTGKRHRGKTRSGDEPGAGRKRQTHRTLPERIAARLLFLIHFSAPDRNQWPRARSL